MSGIRSALTVLLLTGLPLWAAPVRWASPDSPYRAVVKVSSLPEVPDAGIEITLPEFGATLPALTDVLLTDANGELQFLAPVWRGEGQQAMLLARDLRKDQEYYVYFGSNRIQSGRPWQPRASLWMEVRRLPDGVGDFDNWTKLETAWRAATEVDGAAWVRSIYHGVNPFGGNQRFLTHYSGYLRTEKLAELNLYTVSSDASFVLVDGKYEFGWPGEHGPRLNSKTAPTKAIKPGAPFTRIDYYHAKTAASPPAMVLGWRQGEKLDAIPDDAWLHPGQAKLVRLEQAQGGPVPMPELQAISYMGYAGQWLYEVRASLAENLPDGWSVRWAFTDGSTSTKREYTHVVIDGKPQTVAIKLQRGRDEVTGKRRIAFPEQIPAASVKDNEDLQRYIDAMNRENLAELPIAVLRGYLRFLLAVNKEQFMGILADAWLKKVTDPGDALWLPAQLARLRGIAQTDPRKALTELRNIPAGPRAQHAAALDLLELDLLVFYLNDPDAVSRAMQISTRDPKSETARLALVRAGDSLRLRGRYQEAITQYRQAQRSVAEDSAGRKLPAQDRAFSITINDLLERGDFPEADQKLTAWESQHPLAKLDSDFLVLRARALMAFGRWREARAELESFAKLQPDNPFQIDADFYRARTLYEMGEKDEARKIWVEIAKKYPQHPLAAASDRWASKR